ncbi:MAG: PAS domain S-box protein [Verrucomicrobia bacterium]|nr:PAS domain S-box protein [Verrucomicrobiota bacterium]
MNLHRLPLHTWVPSVLATLGLVLTGFAFFYDWLHVDQAVEALTLRRANALGNIVAPTLERALARNDAPLVATEMARLVVVPNLTSAHVAYGEPDRIRFSTDAALRGQPLTATMEAATTELVARARDTQGAQAGFSADRKRLWAAFPFPLPLLPGELRPSRIAVLLTETDMSALLEAEHASIIRRTVFMGAVATAVCGAVWLFFHLRFNRRLDHLVQAVTGYASAGHRAPVPAAGNDEFARIGRAVNQLVTDLAAQESALRESEARFRVVADSAPVLIWMCDTGMRCTHVNRCWIEFTGRTLAQEMGGGWSEGVHPEDLSRCKAVYTQDFPARQPIEIDYRLRRHDGNYRWLTERAVPRFDAAGAFVGYIGSCVDVTERRLAETAREALLTLETQLSGATSPIEVARSIFAVADRLWSWDAGMLELYSEADDSTRSILALDTVDGQRREVSRPVPSAPATPRGRRILREGAELVLRKPPFAPEPGGTMFGDTARVSASLMNVPIRWQDRPVGVLSLQSYTPDAYTREDLRTFSGVADHCGGALRRLQAEQALRDREAQLRLFVEHSPAAVAMLDRNMRYLVASRRWLADYRLGDRDLTGRSHYEIFPEVPEHWRAIHQRCLQGGVERCEADPFPRPDGTTDWVRWEVRPWRTTAGEIGGLIVLSEVITERKRAEDALVLAHRQRDELVRTIDGIVWEADAATRRFTFVSAQAERLLGFPIARWLDDQDFWADHIHPDDRDETVRHCAASASRGEDHQFDFRMIAADGRTVWFHDAVTVVSDGGRPVMLRGVMVDITAAKRAEAEVRRLAVFPQVNPNPVMEIDSRGEVLYANAAAQALATALGFARTAEMLPPDLASLVRDCLTTHTHHAGHEHRHGARTVSWSFYPTGQRDVVHGYAVDVTERHELEEKLRQSQKMEAIGRLAGGVAHDFNNMLTAIIIQADLLAGEDLPSDTRASLKVIRDAASRSAALTQQLLMFSRRQAMRLSDLELNEVVAGTATMLRRMIGEDVELQLHLHATRLVLRADAGMLDQVLMNLAVNSRDAMPDGGRLLIETSELHFDAAQLNGRTDALPGRYAILRVTDTGHGIPPEAMPHIFEPFFTTKGVGEGTGLGLATVFGIIEQHRGWIVAESTPGLGTSFEIALPMIATAPATGDEPAIAPEVRGGDELVLLVEDEPSVRAVTRLLLKSRGYRVLEASDGASALALWADNRHDISLLLTDLVMPGGLSGRELGQRLEDDRPGLRVIYISGYSPELAGRDMQLRAGENYVQKPFSADHLLATVRRALDA